MAVSLTGLDRKTLRRWMILFFLALAVPTGPGTAVAINRVVQGLRPGGKTPLELLQDQQRRAGERREQIYGACRRTTGIRGHPPEG